MENIGRVTCICSDKTGTITEGRLALERLVAADNVSTGKLLGFAALASRRGSGDPIDRAIWEKTAAEEPGTVPEGKLLATFPYTEKRRRETSVVESEEGLLAVTKGSPEVILEMTTLGADQRAAWSREIGNLASEGRKLSPAPHDSSRVPGRVASRTESTGFSELSCSRTPARRSP